MFPLAIEGESGAEAVETALKAARKWAYTIKGVPPDRAEIIAADGNFHGRTIAIVGFSSVAQYRNGFGPFPPGFKLVPFGDAAALAAAITPDTAAFLVEPIQGEGGSEDDGGVTQTRGKDRIRFVTAAREPVCFREQKVDTDDPRRCGCFYQPGELIARPGPLSDTTDRVAVDIDDEGPVLRPRTRPVRC